MFRELRDRLDRRLLRDTARSTVQASGEPAANRMREAAPLPLAEQVVGRTLWEYATGTVPYVVVYRVGFLQWELALPVADRLLLDLVVEAFDIKPSYVTRAAATAAAMRICSAAGLSVLRRRDTQEAF